MPKGVSINQQCGKLEHLLFESHYVAETNFFSSQSIQGYVSLRLNSCTFTVYIELLYYDVVSSYEVKLIKLQDLNYCARMAWCINQP